MSNTTYSDLAQEKERGRLIDAMLDIQRLAYPTEDNTELRSTSDTYAALAAGKEKGVRDETH